MKLDFVRDVKAKGMVAIVEVTCVITCAVHVKV